MKAKQNVRVWIFILVFGLQSQVLAVDQARAPEQGAKAPVDLVQGPLDINLPPIKYTYSPPEEPGTPYAAFPNWLQSWKDFKKRMEEQHGTSISILMDDHHQQIFSGPGAGRIAGGVLVEGRSPASFPMVATEKGGRL